MKSAVRRVRWFIVPMLLLVVAATSVPTTHGGSRWSGIDPILTVDDRQFNIRIEYPSEYDCSLASAITVIVTAPIFSSTDLITESMGTLGGCTQISSTIMLPSFKRDTIDVRVLAVTAEPFAMKVKVDRDNGWVAVKEGRSNRMITLRNIVIDSNENWGIDPVLEGLPPNTMQYIYYE